MSNNSDKKEDQEIDDQLPEWVKGFTMVFNDLEKGDRMFRRSTNRKNISFTTGEVLPVSEVQKEMVSPSKNCVQTLKNKMAEENNNVEFDKREFILSVNNDIVFTGGYEGLCEALVKLIKENKIENDEEISILEEIPLLKVVDDIINKKGWR